MAGNKEAMSVAPLFEPFQLGGLLLANRIVMAPMGRSSAQEGVLAPGYVPYYRRRAEGGTGLILGEATGINHAALSQDTSPFFCGERALAMWSQVCHAVQDAGARFMPQLWHAGLARAPGTGPHADLPSVGPSGWYIPNADEQLQRRPGRSVAPPMSRRDMDQMVEDFAVAAVAAQGMGCDGIEIHGAHGYIFDQFFWSDTNLRADAYGTRDYRDRTRFAVEVLQEIRRRVGPDYPILFRFSQWKIQDYEAEIVRNPHELRQLVEPLAEAGVTAFHVSTRRFWDAAFEGSPTSLAGWTRRLSELPTILVGSVGIEGAFGINTSGSYADYLDAARAEGVLDRAPPAGLDRLMQMFEAGEFDLVAVGRAMIANPDWANLIRAGNAGALRAYDRQMLTSLD